MTLALARGSGVCHVITGLALERHARAARPTPAGQALARHAGKVLDEIAARGPASSSRGSPSQPATGPTRPGLVAAGLGIAATNDHPSAAATAMVHALEEEAGS
jgi:hypothetical protein